MAIEAGAPVSAIRVDGSLVYKGAIDAASPPDLTSAKKGDYYKISGAGTINISIRYFVITFTK